MVGTSLERSQEAQAYTSVREYCTTDFEMLWLSRTYATRGHLQACVPRRVQTDQSTRPSRSRRPVLTWHCMELGYLLFFL